MPTPASIWASIWRRLFSTQLKKEFHITSMKDDAIISALHQSLKIMEESEWKQMKVGGFELEADPAIIKELLIRFLPFNEEMIVLKPQSRPHHGETAIITLPGVTARGLWEYNHLQNLLDSKQ